MKAFLVDPIARTVRELDHNGGLDEIYASLQCREIEIIRIPKRAVMFIDENGKLKGPRDDLFYIATDESWQHPTDKSLTPMWDVFGRGLIFGPEDGDGDVTPAPFTLAEVIAMVRFTDRVLN